MCSIKGQGGTGQSCPCFYNGTCSKKGSKAMTSERLRPEDLGFGRLFERIQDAVIVADAGTQRIALWNAAAARMFGYSVTEAMNLRVEALVPEPLKAAHRAGI